MVRQEKMEGEEEGERKMFPLNTVRVYKTKELGREEMRFG